VRPLLASEYAATLAAAGPTDNVRLTAAAAPGAAQTVNAIVAAGGTLDGSGTVTITSGMFVNTGTLITHSGRINFGAAEGMLYTSGAATFSGPISGSGGLIKAGLLDATLSGANTYTGTTTILAGGIRFSADVLPNTAGAFGNSDAPIILLPGATNAGIFTTQDNLVLARDLIVRGNGTGRAVLGATLNSPKRFILDGNITLERELTLQGSILTAAPMTLNGTISGSGRLADNVSSTFAILNGNNTFSGGINIFEGGFFAGSDTAFGTGTIWFSSQGRIGAFGAPRTIANPITAVSSGGLVDISIGTTSNGCNQPITFTGVLDLGGGKQGANDGPATISTASGVTATFMSTVRDGGIKYIGGGTLCLLGNNIYTGGTTVSAAGTLIANRFAPGAVAIVFGKAQISLKPTPNDPSGTSVIPSLTITSGSLDLTNNSMVFDYTTPGTLVGDVRSHLVSGRLFSSASTATMRLGYGDNAILGKTAFAGVSPDATSVLIKFTYAGDADLDGDADGVDIGAWATNFTGELGGTGSMVWTQGDWDYDGDVDGVDAGLWAQAFTGELGGNGLGDVVVNSPNIAPGAGAILRGMGITVVPEPAGLLLLAGGALLIPRRRSARSRVRSRDRFMRASPA
jgi:autotransporter-associated beta strand protein